MTIEEFQTRLNTLLEGLPASKFDTVADNVIVELNDISSEADFLGMKSGKKLISNLTEALKTRKAGNNTDDSIQIRLTAMDFYIKNLLSGTTEDL